MKRSATKVPGTDFEVEFREFGAGIRPAPAAIHDPGSGVLRLMTPDVDGLLAKLKTAGVPVASAGGEAASLNGRLRKTLGYMTPSEKPAELLAHTA